MSRVLSVAPGTTLLATQTDMRGASGAAIVKEPLEKLFPSERRRLFLTISFPIKKLKLKP
jgi:hypothetical protein